MDVFMDERKMGSAPDLQLSAQLSPNTAKHGGLLCIES